MSVNRMNPLMRYDALMLAGRERAAQALADEVARRVLAQLEPVITGCNYATGPDWTAAVAIKGQQIGMDRFTLAHCATCGATRRHFVLDSGDAVCIRCCGPGEDFGGESI